MAGQLNKIHVAGGRLPKSAKRFLPDSDAATPSKSSRQILCAVRASARNGHGAATECA
jgi:hypothetical protein